MKVNYVVEAVQREHRMVAAFDVARDELTVSCRTSISSAGAVGHAVWNGVCTNDTAAIEEKLVELNSLATEHSYEGLLVVCEPTGGYEQLLLRTAIRLGHKAAYVSGEAVAKSRVIEFNDTGKTDLRDPQVIASLAERGRLMIYRDRIELYGELKHLHRWYLQSDEARKTLRNQISKSILELFPDLKPKKDTLYGTTGQAIMCCYGFNPHRIATVGYGNFCRRIRRLVPRVWERTLRQIFDAAVQTAKQSRSPGIIQTMVDQLDDLYSQYQDREAKREELQERMAAIYRQMQDDDPRLPDPEPQFINIFGLARFFAETGPLDDFDDVGQLFKYGGLNLRERASGTYRGTNRISKKGSSPLRCALSRIIFSRVRKNDFFGEEYHRRKDAGMPGKKNQVIVMRRMLKILYGWYCSGAAFDRERAFTCESQYVRQSDAA